MSETLFSDIFGVGATARTRAEGVIIQKRIRVVIDTLRENYKAKCEDLASIERQSDEITHDGLRDLQKVQELLEQIRQAHQDCATALRKLAAAQELAEQFGYQMEPE